MHLRDAHPDEAPLLTKLCLISKAYWGYDDAFMKACREELTITARDFFQTQLRVAEKDGCIAGMAQLEIEDAVAVLDKLFIHPDFMGAGIGRALFQWATATAQTTDARVMTINADPGAVPFYKRMGAVDNGEIPSGSIPGRVLPRLIFRL